MNPVPRTLEELDGQAAAFDRLVGAMPEIDRFCSSSVWVLPAAQGLHPGRREFIFGDPEGWLTFMVTEFEPGVRALAPMDISWGLSCPFVGPDPDALAAAFVDRALEARAGWDGILVTGLPLHSTLTLAVVRRLSQAFRIRGQQLTRRLRADLSEGPDDFLSRRSRGFRRTLRRAQRATATEGIRFEAAHLGDPSPDRLFARIMDVEARSWKGQAEVGIESGPMRAFYDLMLTRLHRAGNLRLLFAQRDGRDLAYVLGGITEGEYRGLQFSYDADEAHLSLGSLCQWTQIQQLCVEGIVTYDLGMDMAYKHRWADHSFDTHTLWLTR